MFHIRRSLLHSERVSCWVDSRKGIGSNCHKRRQPRQSHLWRLKSGFKSHGLNTALHPHHGVTNGGYCASHCCERGNESQLIAQWDVHGQCGSIDNVPQHGRGYKPATKQAVGVALYNLASAHSAVIFFLAWHQNNSLACASDSRRVNCQMGAQWSQTEV